MLMKKIFTFLVAMVAMITIGNAQCGINFSYPYSCDFSLEIPNGCWEVDDVNGDNYTWQFDIDQSVAKYVYNPGSDAEDDLYSPYFYLDGHQTLTFDYRCGNSNFPEAFCCFSLSRRLWWLGKTNSDDWRYRWNLYHAVNWSVRVCWCV